MNFYARTTSAVLFSIFLGQPVWAQTFKMSCELEGIVPALEDRKLKPEKVVVEIQTMGKNLFMKVVGSNLYTVQASSLTTEEFAGKNLTTEKQMGVTRKNKTTGWESEIRIERETVMLTAFNDMDYRGKTVRVLLSGPCIRP
ncbi:MAG: hypothetical protein EBR47_05520 [Betaproteobacteria bacterium]|jgi:hypothetical protein|nr:hypothetical protein [Betaproteobacteria bacterium]